MISILKEEYINNNTILLVALIDTSTNKVKSYGLTKKALKRYLNGDFSSNALWKLNKKLQLF
jgi:hypothetical protein|tara:strand:+ start:110 stop:295 length:186 start_codon:yes stop_codon:yes gene_type:complete